MAAKTQDSKGFQRVQRIGNPPAQRLYDLKSAAEYLGRPVWGVRELIWAGRLPVVRTGRKQYVDIYDMDRFIEFEKTTMV